MEHAIVDYVLLSSAHSMEVSLETIKRGNAGLSSRRRMLLARVPKINDWAKFDRDSISMKDIAFLSAKTDDEFAILRGKKEDILFHGSKYHCDIDGILFEMLMERKLELFGHSHPIERIPVPSDDDRNTLMLIGQKSSRIISAITGREIIYGTSRFK